jgi:DNA-binding HxlR family transcriptional regulator
LFRALEADRLISRTEYPGMPPRVEYALTERGRAVIPVLASLKDWADETLADQIDESH